MPERLKAKGKRLKFKLGEGFLTVTSLSPVTRHMSGLQTWNFVAACGTQADRHGVEFAQVLKIENKTELWL
jgi:hypothetical protein